MKLLLETPLGGLWPALICFHPLGEVLAGYLEARRLSGKTAKHGFHADVLLVEWVSASVHEGIRLTRQPTYTTAVKRFPPLAAEVHKVLHTIAVLTDRIAELGFEHIPLRYGLHSSMNVQDTGFKPFAHWWWYLTPHYDDYERPEADVARLLYQALESR